MIEPIKKLAIDMQHKLDKNKNKDCEVMNPDGKGRGWKHCMISWLATRVDDEVGELFDALEEYESNQIPANARKVQLECADVANFAMMIHNNISKEQKDAV